MDSFSFVLLVSIPSGTQLSFTDNAWLSTNAFRSGEQHMIWTAGLAIAAGREITISGTTSPAPLLPTATISGNGTSAGTCTGNMPSLSTSGDQLIAYQGAVASPTIISAIHMNVYAITGVGDCGNTTVATWDPLCIDGGTGTIGNTSWSLKPPTLTTGTNAIWLGTFDVTASEDDWGVFDPTINNPALTTAAQVRAAVNDQTNWRRGDGAATRRTNPSGATFLGIIPLPVKLISFTGKLNSDKTASLRWEVAEQLNIQQYTLEESNDGAVFKTLGTVPASTAGTDTYTYTDLLLSPGNNYYRLKITELSGKTSYSAVVVLKTPGANAFIIDKLQNPFSGALGFTLTSSFAGVVSIRISDMNGRLLVRETRNLSAGENQINITATQKLPDGMLIMEVAGANNQKDSFRLLKSSK